MCHVTITKTTLNLFLYLPFHVNYLCCIIYIIAVNYIKQPVADTVTGVFLFFHIP